MTDFEREIWRNALELAHVKGYASRTKKESIDRYWWENLDTPEPEFDMEEACKLIGGTD